VDRVVLNAMSSSYFSIVLWRSRSTWGVPTRTFVIPWLFDIRFSGFVQRLFVRLPTTSKRKSRSKRKWSHYLC